MKGVLICKIGALCGNISGPTEGSRQEQTVSKATKDDEEENEQQFINKPAAILPTLCGFLPEEKALLYLESWEVASLKSPQGRHTPWSFSPPSPDLPIPWGRVLVGRPDRLKQEHMDKYTRFLGAAAGV